MATQEPAVDLDRRRMPADAFERAQGRDTLARDAQPVPGETFGEICSAASIGHGCDPEVRRT